MSDKETTTIKKGKITYIIPKKVNKAEVPKPQMEHEKEQYL